jgi:DNA polymerase III subunit gamma/tau
MGSVPNTVFEKLFEAVAAGQSAELMEQLNLLINAGHSPQSLARQMVRYLRNTLMAKIGGEQTELLQISADERARAARTALLFTEEELTRNLQIILRAFDDLNYRQEQRFHLELALLKLIHAQRLLPIEELLSGVAQSGGGRTAAPAPRTATAAARPAASPTIAPPHSPFSPSGSWSDSTARTQRAPAGSTARVEAQSPAANKTSPEPEEPLLSVAPFSVESGIAQSNGSAQELTEGALAEVPLPASAAGALETPPGDKSIESLRQAVCAALDQAGHASAAQLLGAGAWSLDGAMVRIEVAAMGKKMLSLTVNAAAEKIIRETLSRQSAPARFLVVPGEGDGAAARQAAPIAAAGSIQEAALANPIVQRAKEILHAEVRSVVDLREK